MFATNMLVGRAASEFFPPVALAFWRFVIVVFLVSITAGPSLWRMRGAMAREWRDLAALGFLGMLICGAVVYYGVQTTLATNVGLIFAATPILIVVFSAVIFSEAANTRQLVGILLSLSGVIAVICKGDLSVLTQLAFSMGDVWIVCGMTSWALYCVLLKFRQSEMSMQTRFLAICIFGVGILLPFFVGESLYFATPPLTWNALAAALMVGVIAGYGAYQTYGFVQAELGAGTASLIMYLIPIYNAGLAWLFLGEMIQDYHLLGAALVLPGVYLASVAKK